MYAPAGEVEAGKRGAFALRAVAVRKGACKCFESRPASKPGTTPSLALATATAAYITGIGSDDFKASLSEYCFLTFWRDAGVRTAHCVLRLGHAGPCHPMLGRQTKRL